MRTIDNQELEQVAGGWTGSSSYQLSQSLSGIQSTLANLNTTNQNQSSNYLLPLMMMFAMQNRNQRVVSAGGATIVA